MYLRRMQRKPARTASPLGLIAHKSCLQLQDPNSDLFFSVSKWPLRLIIHKSCLRLQGPNSDLHFYILMASRFPASNWTLHLISDKPCLRPQEPDQGESIPHRHWIATRYIALKTYPFAHIKHHLISVFWPLLRDLPPVPLDSLRS
jgi:hypothetical protein